MKIKSIAAICKKNKRIYVRWAGVKAVEDAAGVGVH